MKQRNSFLPLLRVALRKQPKLLETLADRHNVYNETLTYLKKREQAGKAFIIQPPEALNIGAVSRKPEELERVYQIGRNEAIGRLEQLRKFINA